MAPRLRDIVARSATGEIARTPPAEQLVLASLRRTLGETNLCSIASVTSTGRAHVNTAYFAHAADLSLYFLSYPRAEHCGNLARNPSAALAVFRSDQTWGGHDRGVQLFGEVRRLRGRAKAVAEKVYSARFPLYQRWLNATTPEGRRAARQLRSYGFYQFRASRIKVFDDEKFGEAPFVSAMVSQ